tara:strand:- start:3794 stop:5023 length:1230 start_codon:yes stop_codon:yes gene_type:complete
MSENTATKKSWLAERLAFQIGLQAQLKLDRVSPLFLMGRVGLAKTAYAESVAKVLGGKNVFIFSASQIMPELVGGMPYANVEEMCVHLLPADKFAECVKAGPGNSIIILDEMPDAAPMVQAAFHRLFTHGEAGSIRLPDRTAIVGMGNPPDQSTTGGAMSEAITTRSCIVPWRGPTLDAYNAFRLLDSTALANNTKAEYPAPEIFELPSDWLKTLPEVCRKFAAFRQGPGRKYFQTRAEPNSTLGGMMLGRSAPAANPRTWENAEYLLAACDSIGEFALPARHLLLAGCIGEAASLDFFSFEKNMHLPNPEECLFENPALPREDHLLLPVCHAVVAAVVENNTLDRHKRAWDFLARVMRETQKEDMVAIASVALFKNRPAGMKDWHECVKTIAPILEESGLLGRAQRGN